MASIKFTFLLLLVATGATAQTTAEWFDQKNTQKKYLLQQIAALHVYRSYLKNGYSIAKGGLGSIGNSIKSEYGLHNSYYDHLKTANSVVKNNPQVGDILSWKKEILAQTSQIKKTALSPSENQYVARVCDALLKDCDAQLNDLQTVLSDGKVKMDDEARLRQIGRIHTQMQNNYRFVAGFRGQVALYARSRQQQQTDLKTLNALYGNP
jgi:hypothetical protein